MVIGKADLFDGGKKLPVMEEFYTLQGEGFQMGKAAYFVRIGGCDVGCTWCDTKESWDANLFPPVEVQPIVERACQTPAKTVVVTGGEPSRYPLDYFTKSLKACGVTTMIETAGVMPLTGKWDWVCLSPKKYSPPHASVYELVNELKVVIQSAADLEWAEKNAKLVSDNCLLFLQPEWSRKDEMTQEIILYIKENPDWRISMQTHKVWGIP